MFAAQKNEKSQSFSEPSMCGAPILLSGFVTAIFKFYSDDTKSFVIKEAKLNIIRVS